MEKKTDLERGKINKKVLIQASPDIVYHALTNAKDLVRWFCDRAASDPHEGGDMVAYWKSGKAGVQGRAVFTRIVPNALVELLWIDDGRGESAETASHRLSYAILPKRGTTEVTMCDRDDTPLDEETLAVLDSGWNNVLLQLKDYCERKERAGKPHPAEEP